MVLFKNLLSPVRDLTKDADFLEYLEENSVPEEEKQIAFAMWIKENQEN